MICLHLHLGTPLLDIILTLRTLAPWHYDDVLSVEGGNNVLPLLNLYDVVIKRLLRTREHGVMDLLEVLGHLSGDGGEGELRFVTVHSADSLGLVSGNVARSDFETDGNTLGVRDGRLGLEGLLMGIDG